jgi:hypothetical protein
MTRGTSYIPPVNTNFEKDKPSMCGGSFGQGLEQGAITGAYGYVFNQVVHRTPRGLKSITGQTRTPTDPPSGPPVQYEKGDATYWSCAVEKIPNVLTPLGVFAVSAAVAWPLAVPAAAWVLIQTANDVSTCRQRAYGTD